MKNKIIASALTLILLLCMISGTAFAAVIDNDDAIMPMYVGVHATMVSLDIPSSGWADCYGLIQITSGHTAELTLSLMRQSEGSATWSNVTSWTDSTYPYEIEEEYYVSSGYTYRLKLTANVYDDDGNRVSRPIAYSDEVYH